MMLEFVYRDNRYFISCSPMLEKYLPVQCFVSNVIFFFWCILLRLEELKRVVEWYCDFYKCHIDVNL